MSMSRPEVWLVIVLAALVTLAERGSFLLGKGDAPLPPVLKRTLKFVPAAVFAAIALPALTQPSGVAVGPVDAERDADVRRGHGLPVAPRLGCRLRTWVPAETAGASPSRRRPRW